MKIDIMFVGVNNYNNNDWNYFNKIYDKHLN